jgi:macrolide transport system ATP-binding/permease protein
MRPEHWLYTIPLRLRSLFRQSDADQELDDELRDHVEQKAEEYVAKGLPPNEAHRQALLEIGGIEKRKEECRDARRVNWIQDLAQDLRYGLRMLGKNPTFAVVAVLTLALGIGLNSSVVTLFDATVLQLLPVKDPSTVVDVYQSIENDPGPYRSFSYPEYVALQKLNSVFSGLVAYSWTQVGLSTAGDFTTETDQVDALLVSGNYFSVLGGETTVGRTFVPEEKQTSGAVLSHEFWVRRFNSDRGVVGKIVRLNGFPFSVVGVAREDFTGTEPQIPDLWVPLKMLPQLMPKDNSLHDRDSFWLNIIGRLKPRISRRQAQASIDVLISRLAKDYLGADQRATVTLTPGSLIARPDERRQIDLITFLVMCAVGIILLIACANVANLLLARAAGRQKEIGIRLALGATRRRVTQQLLTESCLIATLSGAAGLLLTLWLPGFLTDVLQPPGEPPIVLRMRIDIPVLGCVLLATLATVTFCGLAPALRASKCDPLSAITDDNRTFGQRLSRSRLQNLFVSVEISACLVLLLSAGLLVRALGRAQTFDPGFDAKRVVVVSLDLEQQGYDNTRAAEFYRELSQRLQTLPDVKSISLVSPAPLGGISRSASITVPGGASSLRAPSRLFDFWVVSPNYFETMGIPVLQGRKFDGQDATDGPPVAIINEAMARQVWPGENAVGKLFRLGPPTVPFTRIVGVVRDTCGARLWEKDQPYVYLPVLQSKSGPFIQTEQLGMQLLVRTDANPSVVVATVPRLAKALDANIQASGTVLAKSRDRWVWFSEIGATLASSLGLLALVLAGVGIYGVVSYSVTQRTHEMGIRMALGATPHDLLKTVLWQGLRLSLFGVAIGLAVAAAAVRMIAAMLYGIRATDPLTFVSVSVFLIAVALLACYVPARRAMRVDPMVALRYE